jgi:DNA-binding NtrC family response regulator
MPSLPQHEVILVIDDDAFIRDSCQQALSKAGYCVETAGNGEAGLSKAKEIEPDMALVDLRMPGLSGVEVMDRLERLSPSTIRIVVTGVAQMDLVTEIISTQRALGCLIKPFSPEELNLVVRRAFDDRQSFKQKEDIHGA